MDELIIEQKKYISSKRASKETGYAKDYIGQLCREGRVTARLVGRSWYVLESSIKDHRFGQEHKVQEKASNTPQVSDKVAIIRKDSAFPKYEATKIESLPSLNLLNRTISPEVPIGHTTEPVQTEKLYSTMSIEIPNASSLQDSWNKWFTKIDPSELELPLGEAEHERSARFEDEEEWVLDSRGDMEEVATPVAIQKDISYAHDNAIEKSLAINTNTATYDTKPIVTASIRRSQTRQAVAHRFKYKILITILILTSTATIIFSLLATGSFDRFLISYKLYQLLPGVQLIK